MTFTPAERTALTAARLVAVEAAPYFAAALWRMVPVSAPGLGTFAVDRRWRLYIDPATLTEWGPRLSGGVLVHEVCHLLRDHAGRAEGLGAARDHGVWNLATDAAINDDLRTAKIPLPEGAITPSALGLPPHGIEEAYYADLMQRGGDPSNDPDHATGPYVGCGSGAGDEAAPYEAPADGAEAPAGIGEAEAAIARRQVAEAVIDAASHGRGTIPASLRRWAEDALAPPRVDWRRTLRATLRRAVAWTSGQTDYTYTRPGRRRIPRVLTPAMRSPRVRAAVVVDTSGSMSPDALSAALSEIAGVMKATRDRSLTVITCDAAANITVGVRDPRTLALTGGGGTDMRVGIDAALTMRDRPDVVIVLTDGFTPWPSAPTPVPLVIGLIGGTPDTPSWATTVVIGEA